MNEEEKYISFELLISKYSNPETFGLLLLKQNEIDICNT